MEAIMLTGRQAINLYGFLGGLAKVSEHDRMKQGKLRNRLYKLLEVNEDGEFEALEIVRTEIRYTVSDIAAGLPKEFLDQVAKGPDGKAAEAISYSPESLRKILGEFKYDASEKDALFRIFRARLAASETSGAHSEAFYRLAGLFPNLQKAIEVAQKAAGSKEPGFIEPPPDDLHGIVPDGHKESIDGD